MRYLIIFLIAAIGSPESYAGSSNDKQADVLMLALPATAYLLTWNKKDEPGAWSLTRSLGASALATLALNSLIDKDAPNGSSHDAFPSGHTAIAFSSAAFVQRRYGWRPGIPAYIAATYVGWLRVETDDHDAADVLGGMAVGILSSYLLTKPFGDDIQVAAWSDGKSAGLRFQYRW
jgi:membrane-associated phospholipid phosphatase